MRLAAIVLSFALGLLACGIKAPPKPPLESTQVEERPDGGCCGARP